MHLRILILGLLLAFAQAADLTFSTVLQASAGNHAISIDEVDFLPSLYPGVTTRGFQNAMGGPTFVMAPGETLSLTLTNNLLSSNNVACTATTGEFCEASTTNFHTHGLHISSKGVADGLAAESDNVLNDIAPGASSNYAFAIPNYHMGGTHWYHPHHHHATALQAGGGAAGVIIVTDPDGYLPAEFEAMIEKVLFISLHNLNTLSTIASSAQSTPLANAATVAGTQNQDTNVFLVNGQKDSSMAMVSHQWHRFRMVYAAVEQQLSLTISTATNGAACQYKLLAKDGVYLPVIPRTIGNVIMFPGARADIAVSCTCTTYPCTATLGSVATRRSRKLLQGGGPAAAGTDAAAATLMTLAISETSGGTVTTLPTTTLIRPCYLVDLQNAAATTTGALNLNGGGRVIQWNGAGTSMTYANTHANGGSMATWSAVTTFAVGTVVEMVVTGANTHPLHIHVNPFQITSMPAASYEDDYFMTGDWHDTLQLSAMGGGSTVTVKANLDAFTGKAVVHCHILEHEDEGMMAWFQIDGTEGTQYAAASTIDSSCYNTYYVAGTTAAPTTATGNTANSATISGLLGIVCTLLTLMLC